MRDPTWDELLSESHRLALEIHRKKDHDYGHFSQYPDVVLASNIFTKAKRILELTMRAHVNPDMRPKFESVDDSCLDLINYASFLWAKNKNKWQEAPELATNVKE